MVSIDMARSLIAAVASNARAVNQHPYHPLELGKLVRSIVKLDRAVRDASTQGSDCQFAMV